MTQGLLDHCTNEVYDLILVNGLIRKSKSPWSSSAFVINNAELGQGKPRLVIHYEPQNQVLLGIKNLIPKEEKILAIVFSLKIIC